MAEAELGHLDIRLTMDNSDFNKAVRGVSEDVKDVRKDFRLLEAELKNVEKTEEGLSGSLKKLNKVLDDQKKNVKELEVAYERQVEQYGKNSKEAKRMADALRTAKIDMEKTRTAINRTTKELDKLKETMNETGDSAEGLGDELGQMGDGGGGIGDLVDSFKKLGGKGGIIGVVVGAVFGLAKAFHDARQEGQKASNEIEVGLMSVSDQIDITGRDLEKMSEKYGKSIDEIVQDTRDVHEQLQGLIDPDMYEEILADAQLVSKVTGTDVKDSLIVVEKLMRDFGVSATEAFGYYLWGIEEGLNKGDDFADSFKEYGNQFSLMGLTVDEILMGWNAGLEAGGENVDKISDAWQEFNTLATEENQGFKEALAKLKDESLEQLYQKVIAGEVPMDYFMRTAVEKLQGVDNQRLLNEIGMGLFGDKWIEVGGDAITASTTMVGKDKNSGLKGVDTKLEETADKLEETKTGWQKLGSDFKRKVTDPMLDGLADVWNKLGDLLWRLKEVAEKNVQAYSKNKGSYSPPFPSGYRKDIRMAVPQMATFAMATAPLSLPENRPFLHGERDTQNGGQVVNLTINAPQELSASEVAKKTRQTLNQLSLNW